MAYAGRKRKDEKMKRFDGYYTKKSKCLNEVNIGSTLQLKKKFDASMEHETGKVTLKMFHSTNPI